MFTDFVLNGVAHGDVSEQLAECRFDPGMLRPYFDSQGKRCVTINTGRRVYDNKAGVYIPEVKRVEIAELLSHGISSPVINATSLRKEEWINLDAQVVRAARERLRAWSDLAAVSSFGGFNAMSKMILEHETMSDAGEAVVDMDGLTDARTDSPAFQLEGVPLPMTHSDFWFSSRRLAVSRNSGTPLDTTMPEMAGRRVAESIEKTLIGTVVGKTYGGASTQIGGYGRASTVYGYTNFGPRLTKTDLTAPTGSNAATTLAEVLEMRDLLTANRFYGPFMLYHSADWDQYLDNDYVLTGGNVATQTLRDRLRSIEGIQDVRRLDFFTDEFSLLMVQMTSEVARAIDGMPITIVQWESSGGLRLNFKVMAIQVPQLRADYNGRTGICHASVAA